MSQPLSLYLHIPFCATKCYYCAFFSQEGQEKWIEPYVKAIIREIELTAPSAAQWLIQTIYIGGGTPSLLPAEMLAKIITAVKKNFIILADAEFTIEANPESIAAEKLEAYFAVGCNRLSIGLQAWQSRLLTDLNRPYQIADFERIIQLVQNGPIKNFNLDLIFGLPKQSLEDWRESLTNTIACNPNHISCYSLELDNQSHFGRLWKRGKFSTAKPALDRQMHDLTVELLSKAGYDQYEISNFAKPGFACRHNTAFWHNQPYLGIGAGAESYWQGKSWQNVANLRQYCEALNSGKLARQPATTESTDDRAQAGLVLGLRLSQGISIKEFHTNYSLQLAEWLQPALQKLIAEKLITLTGTHLRLTKTGKNLINHVVVELLSVTQK